MEVRVYVRDLMNAVFKETNSITEFQFNLRETDASNLEDLKITLNSSKIEKNFPIFGKCDCKRTFRQVSLSLLPLLFCRLSFDFSSSAPCRQINNKWTSANHQIKVQLQVSQFQQESGEQRQLRSLNKQGPQGKTWTCTSKEGKAGVQTTSG